MHYRVCLLSLVFVLMAACSSQVSKKQLDGLVGQPIQAMTDLFGEPLQLKKLDNNSAQYVFLTESQIEIRGDEYSQEQRSVYSQSSSSFSDTDSSISLRCQFIVNAVDDKIVSWQAVGNDCPE